MDFSTTVANIRKDSNSNGPPSKLKRENEAQDTTEEVPLKKRQKVLTKNCSTVTVTTQAEKGPEETCIEIEKPKFVVISLNDLPPVEAALSIEKIREKIFSNLDIEDLKNCRLVSHAWRQFSTNKKVIRKKTICMHKDMTTNRFQVTNPVTKKTESLAELSQLISNLGAHSFPCQRFSFSRKNLLDEDQDLQNFLWVYGHNLKRLTFEFIIESLSEYGPNNGANIFKALMKFITELISNQAPNLRRLTIDCNDTFDSVFESRDNEGTNAGEKIIPKSSNPNTSLRCLTLTGSVSITLLDHILSLAPNLNQVELPSKYQNWYVEPGKKRIHLLRDMVIRGGEDSQHEFLRRVANTEERLELMTIYVHLLGVYASDQEVQKEFAELFTKILEKCSHSLEYLEWRRMSFLNVRIPVLPKLFEICFQDSGHDSPPDHFFPHGFRMSESFPGLEIISLDLSPFDEDDDPVDILFGNVDDVVPSVTFIDTGGATLPLEQLKNRFPNAEID